MSDHSETRHLRFGKSPAEIGRFTYGFKKMRVVQFREGAKLKIGSFCSIATGLTIMLGGNHRVDWATTFPFGHIFANELGGGDIIGHPQSKGDVIIGNDVWLGQNTTIMSGITIGDGAVVAANSNVVKDIGEYEVWGGNPAKFIKHRFDDEIIDKLLSIKWWDCSIQKVKRIAPLLSQSPDMKVLEQVAKIASNEE